MPVLIVLAGVAHAEGDEPPAESTKLFERGRALVKEGKHAEACPLFARSMRLAPALGTELNLALCLAETGKLFEARAMLQALVDKTTAAGQPERAVIAQERLDEIAARMPRVAIAARGFSAVRLDGRPVDATRPIEVDPGPHRVEADGAVPVRFSAVEGATAEVTLVKRAVRARPRHVYYLGGAAIGALAFTAIGGIVVLDKKGSALDHCDDMLRCDDRGLELLDSARTWSHVTTGFGIAGLALAAATIYLELDHRKTREVTAWADGSSIGVGLACGF